MHLPLVITFLAALQLGWSKNIYTRLKRDEDWSYNEPNGPDHWDGECNTGTKQSPIDLTLLTAEFIPIRSKLDLIGAHKKPQQRWSSKWNGHAFVATMDSQSDEGVLVGGGLPDKFIFDSLHFHWGSEHTREEQRLSAELHLVHHNSKYSAEDAGNYKDGIAVVGILLEEADDLDSETITEFIESVYQEKQNFKMKDSLRSILPKDLSPWWRYNGSLTTPPCTEAVIWTVITRPVYIDERLGAKLKQNFTYRPIQPLNKRKVELYYFDENDLQDNHVGKVAPSLPVAMVTAAVSLLLYYFMTAQYLVLVYRTPNRRKPVY